jgi:hypothetical protein
MFVWFNRLRGVNSVNAEAGAYQDNSSGLRRLSDEAVTQCLKAIFQSTISSRLMLLMFVELRSYGTPHLIRDSAREPLCAPNISHGDLMFSTANHAIVDE